MANYLNIPNIFEIATAYEDGQERETGYSINL